MTLFGSTLLKDNSNNSISLLSPFGVCGHAQGRYFATGVVRLVNAQTPSSRKLSSFARRFNL